MNTPNVTSLPSAVGIWCAVSTFLQVGCTSPPDPASAGPVPASMVGASECSRCHPAQAEAWRGSHHDLAIQELTEETALGDFDNASFTANGVTSIFRTRDNRFFVETVGPDGERSEFEMTYTFGIYPLQQYLVSLDGGRLQAFSVAWDARPADEGGRRWFHLYPDETIDFEDELHWTSPVQTWNHQCAECHSTGLKKNFRFSSNSYETTWDELDVACEACHGPGSSHVGWAEEAISSRSGGDPYKEGLVSLPDERFWIRSDSQRIARLTVGPDRGQIEVCARCHARRGLVNDRYDADTPLLDTHRPALLESGLYHVDGQINDEVYVFGSFAQSKMYDEGVVCSDCHDAHSLGLVAAGNAVCTQCHAPDVYDSFDHTFHEDVGSNCVDCHMPTKTYMVVDPRRDHSFRIPRPDLSLSLDVPNACNGCHVDQSPDWAARAIVSRRRHDPADRPHFATALAAGRNRAPGSATALAEIAVGTDPDIVRATALSLLEGQDLSRPGLLPTVLDAAADPAGLLRLGAIRAVNAAPSDIRRRVAAPALADSLRVVRLEAVRVLAPVASDLTAEQRIVFDRALDEYVRSQELNADQIEAFLNLGIVYSQLGRFGDAEQAYTDGLRLQPTSIPTRINLADLYRHLGRETGARSLLEEAQSLDPDNADAAHALGLLLVRQREHDAAFDLLERAAELAPDIARYGYVYAVALHSTGQSDRAIEVAGGSLELHPNDRSLLELLAAINTEIGRSDEAQVYLERLRRLDE